MVDHVSVEARTKRLLSIDVLRGLTIIAMLVVNNPGSWADVYPPLRHADWHGLTPTDLVFPFFLFLVGVSLTLSRRLQQSTAAWPWREVLSRTGKLFGLGLLLALAQYQPLLSGYDWWQDTVLQVRWLGVLQRIALVYLACALLLRWSSTRLLLLSGLILLAYGLALLYLPYPAPDGGRWQGRLGPGENLPAWLDQLVLGANHVWSASTPYASDPEGLLSTLPAIVTGLSGILVGRWLQQTSTERLSAARLGLLMLLVIAAGTALHAVMPINKALWTPSFVLVTSGCAGLVLLWLHQALDGRAERLRRQPLIGFLLDYGSNAIFVYVLSALLARLLMAVPVGDQTLGQWGYLTVFASAGPTALNSLAHALVFTLLFWPLLAWLRRVRQWMWKV